MPPKAEREDKKPARQENKTSNHHIRNDHDSQDANSQNSTPATLRKAVASMQWMRSWLLRLSWNLNFRFFLPKKIITKWLTRLKLQGCRQWFRVVGNDLEIARGIFPLLMHLHEHLMVTWWYISPVAGQCICTRTTSYCSVYTSVATRDGIMTTGIAF